MSMHPIFQQVFKDFGMATSKSDAQRAFEEAMAPRQNPAHPAFRDHNCWKCDSGKKPCPKGDPWNCGNLHARND